MKTGGVPNIKLCEPKSPVSLTGEEKIFMFFASDLNKAQCLFLDYMTPKNKFCNFKCKPINHWKWEIIPSTQNSN